MVHDANGQANLSFPAEFGIAENTWLVGMINSAYVTPMKAGYLIDLQTFFDCGNDLGYAL